MDKKIELALSAGGILIYPFLLSAFHLAVGPDAPSLTFSQAILAGLCLALAFAVPAVCLICAIRLTAAEHMQWARVAYYGVAAPTIYVFMGVLLYMAGSPLPDQIVWLTFWLLAGLLTLRSPHREAVQRPMSGSLRVVHGVTAAILTLYVLFHLANHLVGLIGPEQHLAFMKLGRRVYRAPLVEALLVAAMLFQIGSGLTLFRRWTMRHADGFRVFQLASGFYLSLFILGHMNSVFIFARSFLRIETGWGFATGAPAGLIFDAWNIRLVPHYWLGVFFVLAHMVSGLRVVLAAHNVDQHVVDRIWWGGVTVSAGIASAIIAGMCGVRI